MDFNMDDIDNVADAQYEWANLRLGLYESEQEGDEWYNIRLSGDLRIHTPDGRLMYIHPQELLHALIQEAEEHEGFREVIPGTDEDL